MDAHKISKEFPYEQVQTKVTNDVAEGIKKLREQYIDFEHILDVYIHSQKVANNINRIYNPMRYISACAQSSEEKQVLRFCDLEPVYNEVVEKWCKIPPYEFILQYEAYVYQKMNESGIENGLLYERFFGGALSNESLLVVDPSPSFLKKCKKNKKEITFAFTDTRYHEAYSFDKELKSKVRTIDCIQSGKYHRALFFAGNQTQDGIQEMLERARGGLVAARQTNIYLMIEAKHLEKRKSNPALWDYINTCFAIQRIILIDKKAVMNYPKKRAIVILQNDPDNKNKEILVQKTRLLNPNSLATLDFHRVPFPSFLNGDRTLSEMYDTDYIDYSQPNRRKKPMEYKFSAEISIWVSCAKGENGRCRPSYSVYDYPTVEQQRKNTLSRGKAIKTRIPGKWYANLDEAIRSAEQLLLADLDVAKDMRVAIKKKYEGQAVTLKTLVFIHWEKMCKEKGFDATLIKEVFFRPQSAHEPICAIVVGVADDTTIKNVVDAYVTEQGFSDTKVNCFWKQLEKTFDYAVTDKRCVRNPIRRMMQANTALTKNKKEMRRSLTNYSFSKENEEKLILYLLSDKKHPELAEMLLVKYYTGLSNSILRALTREDFIYDSKMDLGQMVVTKTMPDRSNEVQMIMPEEHRRYIPLPSLVTTQLRERLTKEKGGKKSPLFASRKRGGEAITSRQLQAYFNDILENVLDLPSYVIAIFEDEDTVKESDINDYGGDIVRSNFKYNAYYTALLEPEEIDFLMGRKPRTTESQYYCDYKNPYLQQIMRVKLDRWAGNSLPRKTKREIHSILLKGGEQKTVFSTTQGSCNELCIELDLESTEGDEIDLKIFARFGGRIAIEYYKEV